jgi:MFS transporter, DHA1 family, multidrug resistance protein
VFALNAVGLIAASQVNGRLVARLGSPRLLAFGLTGLALSGLAILAVVVADVGGLGAILACLFVLLTSLGLVAPNATALALNDFPQSAGSAAALLGLLQFSVGAGLAPLVGLGGDHDVLPMAIVMASSAVLAVVVRVVLRPRQGLGPDVRREPVAITINC